MRRLTGFEAIAKGVSAASLMVIAGCGGDPVQPVVPEPDPPVLAPPVIRDTITVTAWRRSPIEVPYNLGSKATRTATTLLIVERNTATAISPVDGRPLWTANVPIVLDGLRATGSVYRTTYGEFSGPREDLYLDAETGQTLWSRPADLPSGALLATSPSSVLAALSDTALIARDRSTGALRWIRPVRIGDCGLTESGPCLTSAVFAAGAFHLLRLAIQPSPGYRLIRVTDAGVVTTFDFTDISALIDVRAAVSVDSSGQFVTVVGARGVFSPNPSTGEVRWRAVHLISSNGVIMERPEVNVTAGADPLIHLIYRYSTNLSGGYSREIVRSVTSGRIIRQLLRPAAGLDAQLTIRCGPTGMVILRSAGRFIYIDTRTGAETAGQVVDALTGASVPFPTEYAWVDDYSTGHIVFGTGGANRQPDSLFGFRCRP